MTLRTWLTTPSVPLHELTHAAFALPWADVDIELAGADPRVKFDWSASTPTWAVRLAHLAPTLVGLGILLVLVALFGIPTASTLEQLAIHELGLLVILAANWAVFTYPSEADRRPFR
ncbi:hypothetical protein [Halogeometricum limi]|uniref:Zincin peptidase n=1 Tax=Halogeometricum limi TaxID=555875 RepID=A0A1I6FW23_9EURY|nr:hypothetical protein [Halogeometricum limi]SFR34111.1 hypothetical protein SAMN04488124_0407 [Halogeometricum limi]